MNKKKTWPSFVESLLGFAIAVGVTVVLLRSLESILEFIFG